MGFEEEDGRFDFKNRRNLGPILKIRVFGPLGRPLATKGLVRAASIDSHAFVQVQFQDQLVKYSMSHNSASGPDVGPMASGKASRSVLGLLRI